MIASAALDAVFARARMAGRPAVIGYLVAGDPDLETSRLVIEALAEAGVDLLEIGIPYGDPLADGPTIAAAAHRALERGVDIGAVFDLVAATRARMPSILFTYVNPVVQYGAERFAAGAAGAGSLGAIVPDVPLEELDIVRTPLRAQGLGMPLLVAPTTPTARLARIAAETDAFVYLVSRLGVTGAGAGLDTGRIREELARLRGVSTRPVAVGFGISRPEHVRAIRDACDGVIVGSALIDAFAGLTGPAAARAAASFVAPLVAAAEA